MIKITQINGKELVLNSELISHIETGANTVITMVTGNKIVACESLDEITRRVIEFKRQSSQQLPFPARGDEK